MKTPICLFLMLLMVAGCATQSPAPVVDRTPSVSAQAAVSSASGATYTVKRGETLYRIAHERGVAYRDLAAWNNITDPSTLREGQVLRLTPPGSSENGVAVSQPVQAAPVIESRPLEAGKTPPVVSSEKLKREPKVNKEPYSDGAWDLAQRSGTGTAPEAEVKTEPKPAGGANDAGSGIVWAWPSVAKLASSYGDGGNKGFDFVGKEGDPVTAAADGKVFFVGLQKGYGNLLIIGHANGYISVYAHNRKILVAEKQMVTKGQKVTEMGKSDSETGVKLHFEIRHQGKPVDPALYLPKR